MPIPNAPSGLALTELTAGEVVQLSWTDNSSDELTFRIERKESGGSYVEIAYVYANRTVFFDDSVRPSITYFYRVRARNVSGDSAYLTEQSIAVSAAGTPTASLSVPSTAFTGEVVLIDARGSTNVSKRPQSNGTTSVLVDYGDGYSCKLLASGHAYRVAGTYNVTVTVKNASGASASTNTSITVSDIPVATGINIRTATEQGSASANRTHVQGLIDAAAAANTVEQEVIIPASMVINGDLIMPTPTGTKYITIRSANSGSLTSRKRVGPSDSANMPTIQARTAQSYPSNVAMQTPTTAPTSPPHHYRFIGLHLRKDNPAINTTVLMNIGTDSGGGQNAISKLPHHFIVERCWFDADESVDTSQINTGLRIYANYVSVHDCYLSPYRLIGLGVDTSAISISAGQGPYSIRNNVLVAGSENFSISGGPTEVNTATISSPTRTSCIVSNTTNLAVDDNIALPIAGLYNAGQSAIVRSINAGTGAITYDPVHTVPDNSGTAKWGATPSYIEFRENYLYKELEWRAADPSYNGQDTQIKNLWEAKFGRYVVVDGNVLFQTWQDDQDYGIVIAPRNINGGNSEVAVIRNIQWTNNILRNATKGITLQAGDGTNYLPTVSPVQRMQDLLFENNLFRNIGVNWDSSGAGHQMVTFNGAAEQGNNTVYVGLKRVFLLHNTWDNGTPVNDFMAFTDFGDADVQSGCFDSLYLNNVQQDCGYGFKSNLSITDAAGNIVKFLPPGDSSTWNKNVIDNPNGHTYPPAAITQSLAWSTGVFNDYAAGDFTLKSGNSGQNAATDGTDVGVNMTDLNAATLHTIDGDWSGAVPPPSVAVSNVRLFIEVR